MDNSFSLIDCFVVNKESLRACSLLGLFIFSVFLREEKREGSCPDEVCFVFPIHNPYAIEKKVPGAPTSSHVRLCYNITSYSSSDEIQLWMLRRLTS
jgi:hypothetical protein